MFQSSTKLLKGLSYYFISLMLNLRTFIYYSKLKSTTDIVVVKEHCLNYIIRVVSSIFLIKLF